MEWPKLKNIILIILLITNLFLLSLVAFRSWNASRYQAQARADALEVLKQNGISMEPSALAEDAVLPVATVTRDRQLESESLVPLMGEGNESALGGGQYVYTGTNGEALLRSRGEFLVTLQGGNTPVEGGMEEHTVKALSQMGVDAIVTAAEGDAAAGTVSLLQCWDGVPVRNCTITATYEGGSLISLSGLRLNGVPAISGELELSAVTGLLRFLEKLSEEGTVCNRILTMRAEYRFSTSLTEPSVLWPVWYFETDTGSYRLDVTTDQLVK